jgi:hypothetical protein
MRWVLIALIGVHGLIHLIGFAKGFGYADLPQLTQPISRAWGLGSDLCHASIDGEIHAGDKRTFIGGEERDGSRDFLWLAPATHWDL